MNGKGRPEKLTDDLKRLITTYQKGRKKKAKAPEIQDKLRLELEKQICEEKRGLGWSEGLIREEVESRLPGISRIQKYLVELTPKLNKPSDLDNPWYLGLMLKPEYNISPEAVSYILMVQDWAEKNPTDLWKQPHEPLTIRQALWVSRLYGIISPNPKATKKNLPKMLYSIAHYLYQWAESYATRERICELSGTPFNTKSLDKSLREGGEPITVDKTTITFYRKDQSLYIDTIDKKLLKQMEQIEKDGEK